MSLQNQPVPLLRRAVRSILTLVLCALLAVGVHHFWPAKPPLPKEVKDLTEQWRHHPPIIARALGGWLETATVTAAEDFTAGEPSHFLGVYLGTTKVAMEVDTTFRYHVPLAGAGWSVIVHGPLCLVTAPDVAPTLPVGFDSARVHASAENGWARWNKAERLEELRAGVTAELGKRAGDPEHLALAREACRRTVAEFVAQWLVQEQGWRDDPYHQVVVRFQGETVPSDDGGRL